MEETYNTITHRTPNSDDAAISVKSKSNEVMQRVESEIEREKRIAREKYDEAKAKGSSLLDRGLSKVDEAKERAQDKAEQVQKRAGNVVEEVKSEVSLRCCEQSYPALRIDRICNPHESNTRWRLLPRLDRLSRKRLTDPSFLFVVSII